MLFSPTEIPVGIVTSVIAAPYFLALLRRAHRIRAAG
jgi:ABC-type Fe3+-siderophore transport system permease subunit